MAIAGNIHVSYCNQTTAWVTLLNPEKSDLATSGLTESVSSPVSAVRRPFSVVTWSTFDKSKRNNSKILPAKVTAPSVPRVIQKAPVELPSNVEKKRTSDVDDVPRKKKKKENSV